MGRRKEMSLDLLKEEPKLTYQSPATTSFSYDFPTAPHGISLCVWQGLRNWRSRGRIQISQAKDGVSS